MSEIVNHPRHYNLPPPMDSRAALESLGFHTGHFQEECIDAMLTLFGPRAFFWFCLITTVKYLWRAGHKADAKTDFAKARWYAERGLKDGLAAQMWRFRLEDALKEIPTDADQL